MLALSLLTTLAVVARGHRQPFTAFHPAQFSRVHAPSSAPAPVLKRQVIHPAQKSFNFQSRPAVQFRRTQPYQQQRFQSVRGQYQYQGPFNTFGSSSSSAFFRASGNIIEQTRAQADSTKALLRSLGNNRRAVEYIDAVLESNKCLDDLDDAIDAIESAAVLVEKNGPEILSLYEVVESLEGEKDLIEVVKTSAEVLRQLAVLVPNLATEPSKLCNASPEDTIESFSNLAKSVEDISNTNKLQISSGVRQRLRKSSKIISDTTAFMGKLNKSLGSFSDYCAQGKQYQNEFLIAVVATLEDLAVLFEGFDNSERATGIRKNSDFVKKLVDTFDELDIDADLNCGSFDALATTLDELAEVIESIGIEKLSEQLGLELNFV